MSVMQVPGLLTFTLAILVYFAGAGINRALPILSRWNIPEAVTGGTLAALVTLVARDVFRVEIAFALAARDMLLLYFFTGIGLNARFAALGSGGRPFLVLLTLTVVFLVIQNLIAVGSTSMLGLPAGMAIFLGSASLIGGHGTTIAWAPLVEARFGLHNALEVGIASATLGLVLASVIGGPLAHFLIVRHRLAGPAEDLTFGLSAASVDKHDDELSYVSFLRTLLVMNIAIIIGFAVHELVADAGITLPLFVICLLVAIVMTNLIPFLAPRLPWPTHGRALSVISDLSLSIFLSMSLMSMQLWTLDNMGFALLVVLALQTVATIVYTLVAVFPALGRNYDAAVISAGFCGIVLGATPTAIANMTAVTKAYGAAPIAFIVLPLVSAFFIDIANAAVIGFLIQ